MKKRTPVCCLLFATCLLAPSLASADAVIDLLLKKNAHTPAISQAIQVKAGAIMLKGVGGDREVDALYRRQTESLVIIDHRKQTIMTVDEGEVARVNRQTKDVEPLLQGVASQVAKLSPEQRQKWQELLGDTISLDTMAKAAEPLPAMHLLSTKRTKKVAGIRCQEVHLQQGETPMADLCLAEGESLKIPAEDEATLRALLAFYERIVSQGQGTARQLGLSLPTVSMDGMSGIPVSIQDLSRDDNGGVTVSRIQTSAVDPAVMTVPSNYRTVPLSLWP